MCLKPYFLKSQGIFVPCGKCIECRLMHSKEWAFRVALEARLHEQNCFITLTYNEDNLPERASLKRDDLQKFVKRLRKKIAPTKIKIFYCGEYGSDREYIDAKGKRRRATSRPHYHLIVFGYNPSDRYFFCKDSKGTPLDRSPTIEKLWTLGNSTVGDVSYDTAKYCAIYLQKPPDKTSGKVRPFVGMSTRPAIAKEVIDPKYIFSDKVYLDGKYIKLPRYFIKKLAEGYPKDVLRLMEKRKKFLDKYVNSFNYRIDSDGVAVPFYNMDYAYFENQQLESKERTKRFERIFKKTLDKDKMI